MLAVIGRVIAAVHRIADRLVVAELCFHCTLLIHGFDLLTETVRILFDLQKVVALKSLHQAEGSHTVGVASVVHTLEADLHHTAVNRTAAGRKGSRDEIGIGAKARRRKREQHRHVLTAAKNIQIAHILAGLAFSFLHGAVLVERTGRTNTAGGTVTRLAVNGRTKRRYIVVILRSLRPVGAGVMIVEDHALDILGIVGVLRVIAGDLKLQAAASRNLHTWEAQTKPLVILGYIHGDTVVLDNSGQNEILFGLHHGVFIVVSHKFVPPKFF